MEAGGCAPRLVSLPGIAWRAADQRKSHELALGFALRGFICFLRSLSFPAPPEVSRVLGQFRATWKLGGAFRSLGAQAPASSICSGQLRSQLFLACGEDALRSLCGGPLSVLRRGCAQASVRIPELPLFGAAGVYLEACFRASKLGRSPSPPAPWSSVLASCAPSYFWLVERTRCVPSAVGH